MTVRLLLVRHGESEWNATGRWQGWADPPLSPQGRAEAAAAVLRLQGFAGRIFASDLRRASQTATIIASRLGLGPVEVDIGLREVDVGEWTGKTVHEIESVFPEEYRAWREGRRFSRPGGEPADAFRDRILDAVARVAKDTPDEGLVVTHGGVIREIERVLNVYERNRHVPNLAGRWIAFDENGMRADGDRVELVPEHGPEPEAL